MTSLLLRHGAACAAGLLMISAHAEDLPQKASPSALAAQTFLQQLPPLVVPAGNPGLRETDGRPHPIHTPNVAPRRINVLTRAAELGLRIDTSDTEYDDQPAIDAVLTDAQTTAGSTVYFPAGTYNLFKPAAAHALSHLLLNKSGVNIQGEGIGATIFKSHLDTRETKREFNGITVAGAHDIVLKDFTFTSNWNRNYATDPTRNNPDAGGLYHVIVTRSDKGQPSYNVTIDSILVEKFTRMGFRIAGGSHDVVVKNAIARNATDVGGGGAGYGFVIQGQGHQSADSNPFIADPAKDTYFNLIENSRTEGMYIRHSALIQYWAHHNLVTRNTFELTRLDAIDLHGEDEYANEVSHNRISGSMAAAIGLGNSGAGHDKTGVHNWIHHNEIIGCGRGITVQFGTRASTIERNIIRDNTDIPVSTKTPACGVMLGKSADSVLRDNVIINNTVSGFIGVLMLDDKNEGEEPAGGPVNWTISGNKIINSGRPFGNRASMDSGNRIQSDW